MRRHAGRRSGGRWPAAHGTSRPLAARRRCRRPSPARPRTAAPRRSRRRSAAAGGYPAAPRARSPRRAGRCPPASSAGTSGSDRNGGGGASRVAVARASPTIPQGARHQAPASPLPPPAAGFPRRRSLPAPPGSRAHAAAAPGRRPGPRRPPTARRPARADPSSCRSGRHCRPIPQAGRASPMMPSRLAGQLHRPRRLQLTLARQRRGSAATIHTPVPAVSFRGIAARSPQLSRPTPKKNSRGQ